MVAWRMLLEGKAIDNLIKKSGHEKLLISYQQRLSSESLVVMPEWDRDARVYTAPTVYGQNVAIVPVLGAMTKKGDLCSYGMRDYIGMIERANKSDKIAGILLDMETPGGTVDGTNEFGMAVKNSKKPVVAFGDGMVASAGYWVASQAREIIANKNNPTEFGSIGVLYIHENYQAFIQKEIGSVEIIRAPQSQDKARINVIEPMTSDQREGIVSELKDIATEFIKTVKKGRGERLQTGEENIFTGNMYKAQDALSIGMIDRLDTLQGAINRVGDLAINGNVGISGQIFHANTNMNMKYKSNLFSALFGKSDKAENGNSADDQDNVDTAKVDDQVAQLESDNARLIQDNDAQKNQITELQKTISEHEAQIKALTDNKATIEGENKDLQAKLDKEPAGHATTVVSETDPDEAKNKDKFRTSVDDEVDKYISRTTNNQ